MNNIDVSKADNKNLTFTTVKKMFPKLSPLYRLANYKFQIEYLYKYSSITILSNVYPKLLKLNNIIDTWQRLPKLGERATSRLISIIRG